MSLFWSDRQGSYLIADSAASHNDQPEFDASLLGQCQRLQELAFTVERC